MDNNWDNYVFINSAKTRLKILKMLYIEKDPLTPKEIFEKLNREHKLSQISIILKELQKRNLIEVLNKEQHYGNIYRILYGGKEIIIFLSKKRFKEYAKEYFIQQGYTIKKNVIEYPHVHLIMEKNGKRSIVHLEVEETINYDKFIRRLGWLDKGKKSLGANESILVIRGYFSEEQLKHDGSDNLILLDRDKLNYSL